MSTERYNGWANYETWVTNLWIDEGYAGGSEAVFEKAKELLGDSDPKDATRELTDWLQAAIEVDLDVLTEGKLTSGLFSDLLGHAMDRIDWREIAEHYIGDAIVELDITKDEEEEA